MSLTLDPGGPQSDEATIDTHPRPEPVPAAVPASVHPGAVGVECRGLARQYGTAAALHGVDLDVAPGEFMALLGPSGSGKTTLLRIIAGLEAQDAGSLRIGGQDMTSVPARERQLGFVFQSYALFRHMTVAENIGFGLRVRPRASRPGRPEIRARVAELLALVELSGMGGRYPDQMSGGQRQRVALARALAIAPRLLLLDEPFGALDAKVRKTMRRWLRDMHRSLGLTSIFVTHDQDEAMELADRVAVLRAGRIEQVGSPEALHAAPATRFVHEFLGETGRLDCVVRDGWAHFGDAPAGPVAAACPDGPAVAVVRLHEVGLGPARDGSTPWVLRAAHRAGATTRVELEGAPPGFEPVLPPGARVPAPGTHLGVVMTSAVVYPREG